MLLQELKEQSYKLSPSDRLELISAIAQSLQKSREMVDVDPKIIQNQRPAFGVMKGSGEILGDIVAPALPESAWEVLQ
ncbi:type II toxin-antitoxin system Phd/YefM family antitoxin [Pseudanabaena mucicola]|uniref:Type II toxin-antitoxin system Phd/YefM family antitoxin n=1 Tax=Pseudanabaena mucicola FACHB-723 TaxID=2692860 RepID=A0ABR7ZYZ9_9CYAN|nr:type II toxin-antitoxin system Phd/YefM family antitoxin [Pseudanabaena mucicola]MBD2189188.1 type II toxin-antitoxin system Phd/YefM family antitoxin [Pseudanabaena mucicola FACHB-723]